MNNLIRATIIYALRRGESVMVVVLEPVCRSWAHEVSNAGMLRLIKSAFDDNVTFIADNEHIKRVRKISGCVNVDYVSIMDDSFFDKPDNYGNIAKYLSLLKHIKKKYEPASIYVLAAYRPMILAVILAASINKRCNYFILLHHMIENYGLYKNLFQSSNKVNNLRFLTYSPYCTSSYLGINENKILFVDHPYFNLSIQKKLKKRNTIICVVGQCANIRARNIIREVNKKKIRDSYEFWIMSKYGDDFIGLENTKIMENVFEREKLNIVLSEVNYLLLPYKDEYDISASGVLWDAVSTKTPCLMLDSRYFRHYEQYRLGYIAENVKEMADLIENIINGSEISTNMFVGLDELDASNKDRIKEFICAK